MHLPVQSLLVDIKKLRLQVQTQIKGLNRVLLEDVYKRQGMGLQLPDHQFKSGRRLLEALILVFLL